MLKRYSLHIGLTIKSVSVGGSTIIASSTGTSRKDTINLAKVLNIFDKYIDNIDLCSYRMFIDKLISEGRSVLLFNRDIVNGRSALVIPGSSIKGVIRSTFEKMILDKIIINRSRLLVDTRFMDNVQAILKERYRRFAEEVLFSIFPREKYREGKYRELSSSIFASYLLAVSPYDCLTTTAGLSCSIPQDRERASLFNLVNKLLVDIGVDTGCINTENGLHCLPLNSICITCALFGAQGFASIPKFRTFNVEACESSVITFNRVFAGDKPVTTFNIEFLGFEEPVRAEGTIDLVIDANRVRNLVELSYLKYVSTDDNVLDKDIASAIVDLVNASDEDIVDKTINLYKVLFDKVLSYMKENGSRLGIGFGRRKKLGFGKLVDYRIEEV